MAEYTPDRLRDKPEDVKNEIELPAGVCIGCPCWKTDGTCLKDDLKMEE